MGETKRGVLYLNDKPLNIIEIPEITFGSNTIEDEIRSFTNCKSCQITGQFSYPKISRKKFVRFLMNQGYSKKDAKWLSWYYQRKRISYGRAKTLITFGLSIK